MTRDEIDATEYCNQRGLGTYYVQLIESFALDVVRRSKNEDIKIAEYYAVNSVTAKNIGKQIQESKP